MFANTSLRRIACVALGATVALATPLAAEAGQPNAEVATPRIAVPHVPVPGPGGVAGCWSANRLIYGPYRFSFCSNGQYGSYAVRGGGLNCNGTVNVRGGAPGTFTVQLSRSRCNGYTDWSADYLVCRSTGGWGGGYGGGPNANLQAYPNAEVAVPRAPVPRPAGRLNCTYYPVAAGYPATGLAMVRN